jgi:DNA helicase-2/ATP-dependent DNA helicase PcrA
VATLAELAQAQRVPMFTAATSPELLAGLRPAARTSLAQFASLIADLRMQARDAAVDELLRVLVDAIRYEDHLRAEGPEGKERIDNVRELMASAAETVSDEGGEVGLTPLDVFLQRASLVAGIDALDPNADAVVMMTMHNAKGLEFPVVFVTGLEDGLFPLARSYEEPALLEEERRLFYVGITRAERKLFITHAEQRRRNGELLPSKPSSFLSAIPRDLLDQRQTPRARNSGRAFMGGGAWDDDGAWGRGGAGVGGATRGRGQGGGSYGSSSYGASKGRGAGGAGSSRPATDASVLNWGSSSTSRPARATPPADEDISQDAAVIAVGARVRHAKFGAGTIAELTGSGRDAKARIDFDDEAVGRKTLVVAQANLEREWE